MSHRVPAHLLGTSVAVLAALAVLPGAAQAQVVPTAPYSIDIEFMRPTFGHGSLAGVDVPMVKKPRAFRYALYSQYEANPLTLYDAVADTELGVVVADRVGFMTGVSYDLSERVTIGGMLPAAVLSGAPVVAPSAGQVATTNGLLIQGSNVGQMVGPPALAWLVTLTADWQSGYWMLQGAALAVDAIGAQKLRSGLTILGIVIGVSTVMAMASIVSGVRGQILNTLEVVGPTTFRIVRFFSSTPLNPDARPREVRIRPVLTSDEAEGIADLPEIRYSAIWLAVLERLSDELLVIHEGRNIAHGEPHHVIDSVLGDHVVIVPRGVVST